MALRRPGFCDESPDGFINLTKFDRTGIAGGALTSLGSTYIRVAECSIWLAGSAAGIQVGAAARRLLIRSPYAPVTPLVSAETKATAVDGQMQGHIGDMQSFLCELCNGTRSGCEGNKPGECI